MRTDEPGNGGRLGYVEHTAEEVSIVQEGKDKGKHLKKADTVANTTRASQEKVPGPVQGRRQGHGQGQRKERARALARAKITARQSRRVRANELTDIPKPYK
jgi:hypothetical protein